jgi:hypothetical protein
LDSSLESVGLLMLADPWASASVVTNRHEISHLMGKRDFGLNERFVNSVRAAGDKKFVCPGDGEERPERNAYQ